VIVFNGNAGHRAMRAPLAIALARRGISSFLFDYRGYGGNPGAPSEAGLGRDARAARGYVAGRADVDADRLVYFGESLGAAVAVRLASETAPLALVLRSPFTSLPTSAPSLPVPAGALAAAGPLSLDRSRAAAVVSHLVVAGDRDGIIPMAQSREVYAAAREPKRMVVVEGADHNDDDLVAGTRLIEALVGFVNVAGPRAP
jgi:fermentation-respiration switch protein FrsA (DUF1100 family)